MNAPGQHLALPLSGLIFALLAPGSSEGGAEALWLNDWQARLLSRPGEPALAWQSWCDTPPPADLRLHELVSRLGLSCAETLALALAASVELDVMAGRVVAWLQSPTGGGVRKAVSGSGRLSPSSSSRPQSRAGPAIRDARGRSGAVPSRLAARGMTRPAVGGGPRTPYLEEKAVGVRTVGVFGTISDSLGDEGGRRLSARDAESGGPSDMLVSRPGGHRESGDTIHDLVRFISAPVNMIGTGWVGSAATHLYLAAPRERRFCLPNTRFLIHQPSGGAGGPASDIAIQAREMVKARERIAGTIARQTGKPLEVVLEDIERDRWMSAEEAVDYGLVSRVIEHKTALKG